MKHFKVKRSELNIRFTLKVELMMIGRMTIRSHFNCVIIQHIRFFSLAAPT